MSPNGSLLDHECTFDDLVQNLLAIGKNIDSDELMVLYANSLPVQIFWMWIQSEMAFIDNLSITEFKGRVREEARRLNIAGLGQTLGIERDLDTVQANLAQRSNRIFPPRKPNTFPPCNHCGYRNHAEQDCHKRIAEEYMAKEAHKSNKSGGGGRGSRNQRRGGGNTQANVADSNSKAPMLHQCSSASKCCNAATLHQHHNASPMLQCANTPPML